MKTCNKKRIFNVILSYLMILSVTLSTFLPGSTSFVSASTISAVTISESGGWLESAYVKWLPVTNATGYNVYYKDASAADSSYVQIDTELIRQYSTYIRADVLGLSAGNYVLKIVPIINGTESSSDAAVTSSLTVSAHTREGFAFSNLSTAKTGSGGYNDDGSVPSNAQIIYVTADTVNTVTLDVITSSNGKKTTCTGLVNILASRQKGYDTTPLIIRMIGTIKAANISGLNSNGYLQVKGCLNVTFEGVGEDATVYGWGLLIRSATNVEIRNLGLMLFPDDGISLDTDNENIWVHNNDIFYGAAGSDADQVKGDGSCDVKGLSTYVTVSYNHFWDSGKCSLCGMSDTQNFFVTYHHNWYDHSDSRHPRIRVGTIHIYNNYFDGNSKYGVGVTKASSAFVEANYFRNCKYPMLISLQGTDVYNDSVGTFSSEAGGMIKAFNNTIIGAKRLVYQTENSTEFDAVLVSSRNETVSSSYKTISGGTTYNNFDTSSTMYSYTPNDPDDVVSVVTTYAGRLTGGDFVWEFNDSVDDTSDGVNAALMSAITSYKSDLVSVGGNSIITSSTTTTTPTILPTATVVPTITSTPAISSAPTTIPTTVPATTSTVSPTTVPTTSSNLYVHNFTENGRSSSFFTISGNLSTSKGTVTYNGLSLTQCLKLESATAISFNTTDTATLTLVFNSSNSTDIKIDGSTYSLTNGILRIELKAGSHTITKASTGNLYYISLSTSSITPTTVTPVSPTIVPTVAPTTVTTLIPTTNSTVPNTTSSLLALTNDGSSWDGGYTMNVYIKNISGTGIDDWKLIVNKTDFTLNSIWSAEYTSSGDTYVITPASWSKAISAGNTVNFGFNGTGSMPNNFAYILKYYINGIEYTINKDNTSLPTATPTTIPTTAPTTAPTTTPTIAPTIAPTTTPTASPVAGNAIYVSPNGTGSGTLSSPTSIKSAINAVQAGQTIYLLEGTYTSSEQLTIPYGNNGTASAYKTIMPYNNAKVTLDFSSQVYGDTATNPRGIQLDGNYWHIYGIKVTGSADNGIFVTGKNNIIELCELAANRDTGLQISRRNSSLSAFSDWPANNLIKNCTSYNNMDTATGENADGFAAKLTCGNGNVFDGCISYNNVDDGWDLYTKTDTGAIGSVTIKNCIAFRNGCTSTGVYTANSDGNGFKLGGSSIAVSHYVENCIAFENKNHGFTDNSNPGTITLKNCTSFNNSLADGGKSNFDFARTTSSNNIFINLISFSTKSVASDKYKGTATNCSFQIGGKYYLIKNTASVDTKSSGGYKGELNSTGVKTSDFVSLSSPSLGASVHTLWRNSDGSINIGNFLAISSNSSYQGLGASY